MRVTASQIDRAIRCPASVLLPIISREPGPAAIRGTRIHAWVAAMLRGWKLPDIGRTKTDHIDIGQLTDWLAIKANDDVFCELAMTWDPDTRATTVHGENIGREYPQARGIPGTADIVVSRPHALVCDIKTGQRRVPASESWQLKHNAVALANARGCEQVTACLAYLQRDGSWEFDDVTWGHLALESIADDLAVIARHHEESAALYADGWDGAASPSEDNCRYCDCDCQSRHVG